MTDAALKNEFGFAFIDRPVSHGRAAAFGVASIGTVIFVITPQLLLLYFMTDTLGIPAAYAGLAILVPKLIEFFLDIGVGTWSDRQVGKHGRRLPFMRVGAWLFPFAFAAVFAVPSSLAWPMALAWVVVAMLMATSAYTLFSVPYITLAGELSPTPAMRLRITAWRMAFVAIGVLIAGGVAPELIGSFGGGRAGYAAMGALFAILAVVVMGASIVAARGVPPIATGTIIDTRQGVSLSSVKTVLLQSREYQRLWVSYMLQLLGISVNAAMLPYAVEYQLRAGADFVSVIFIVMTLGTLLAMPLTVRFAARQGSVTSYILSLLLSAAGVAAMAFAAPAAASIILIAAGLFGLGQAGGTSLPFAMLPSAFEARNPDLARANAGAMTGIWVAGEKLGLAAGAGLAGVLLGAVGYQSGASVQTPGTLAAIPWIFGPLAAIFMLLAIIPLLPLRASPLNAKAMS
ncbi:MAG: MFS transporter [Sphingopyxis sp.]|nr:MFS transporter [Sphingopyxis sp.]